MIALKTERRGSKCHSEPWRRISVLGNALLFSSFVVSRIIGTWLIPAQVGIQATSYQALGHLDSCSLIGVRDRFRRSDMKSLARVWDFVLGI